VLYVAGDIGDQATVENVIEQIKEKYGQLKWYFSCSRKIVCSEFLRSTTEEISKCISTQSKRKLI